MSLPSGPADVAPGLYSPPPSYVAPVILPVVNNGVFSSAPPQQQLTGSGMISLPLSYYMAPQPPLTVPVSATPLPSQPSLFPSIPYVVNTPLQPAAVPFLLPNNNSNYQGGIAPTICYANQVPLWESNDPDGNNHLAVGGNANSVQYNLNDTLEGDNVFTYVNETLTVPIINTSSIIGSTLNCVGWLSSVMLNADIVKTVTINTPAITNLQTINGHPYIYFDGLPDADVIGGNNNSVQFNASGTLGGNEVFTYANNILRVPIINTSSIIGSTINCVGWVSSATLNTDTVKTYSIVNLTSINGSAYPAAAVAPTAGGANGSIQYNNGGVLGGNANFTYDSVKNKLTTSNVTANVLNINGATSLDWTDSQIDTNVYIGKTSYLNAPDVVILPTLFQVGVIAYPARSFVVRAGGVSGLVASTATPVALQSGLLGATTQNTRILDISGFPAGSGTPAGFPLGVSIKDNLVGGGQSLIPGGITIGTTADASITAAGILYMNAAGAVTVNGLGAVSILAGGLLSMAGIGPITMASAVGILVSGGGGIVVGSVTANGADTHFWGCDVILHRGLASPLPGGWFRSSDGGINTKEGIFQTLSGTTINGSNGIFNLININQLLTSSINCSTITIGEPTRQGETQAIFYGSTINSGMYFSTLTQDNTPIGIYTNLISSFGSGLAGNNNLILSGVSTLNGYCFDPMTLITTKATYTSTFKGYSINLDTRGGNLTSPTVTATTSVTDTLQTRTLNASGAAIVNGLTTTTLQASQNTFIGGNTFLGYASTDVPLPSIILGKTGQLVLSGGLCVGGIGDIPYAGKILCKVVQATDSVGTTSLIAGDITTNAGSGTDAQGNIRGRGFTAVTQVNTAAVVVNGVTITPASVSYTQGASMGGNDITATGIVTVGTLKDGVLTITGGAIQNATDITAHGILKTTTAVIDGGVAHYTDGVVINGNNLSAVGAITAASLSATSIGDGVLTINSGAIQNVVSISAASITTGTQTAHGILKTTTTTMVAGVPSYTDGVVINGNDLSAVGAITAASISAASIGDGVLTINSGAIQNVVSISAASITTGTQTAHGILKTTTTTMVAGVPSYTDGVVINGNDLSAVGGISAASITPVKLVDGSGTGGSSGQFLTAGTGNVLSWVNAPSSGSSAKGGYLVVDSINGVDATGSTSMPYKTITAAITAASGATSSAPITIFVLPGTYSGTLTIPQYVCVMGASQNTVIITSPITMNANSRLESITLNLLNVMFATYGITFGNGTSATSKVVNCSINISGGVGYTVNLVGVYITDNSTGSAFSTSRAIRDCNINITVGSGGDGATITAGVYMTNVTSRFAIYQCAIGIAGGTTGVGILNATNTGGFLTVHNSTVSGVLYDVNSSGISSYTANATIELVNTDLINNKCGIYGFMNGGVQTVLMSTSAAALSGTGTVYITQQGMVSAGNYDCPYLFAKPTIITSISIGWSGGLLSAGILTVYLSLDSTMANTYATETTGGTAIIVPIISTNAPIAYMRCGFLVPTGYVLRARIAMAAAVAGYCTVALGCY